MSWYRDPDELRAALAEHGSLNAAAAAKGGSRATVQKWAKQHGVFSEIGKPSGIRPPEVDREELLEQELRELRAAYDQLRQNAVFEERIVRYLEGALDAKEPVYSPAPKPPKSTYTPHEFCLLWSDLHAAEMVSAEQTNGLNEYDWKIMLDRHQAMHDSILSFKENRPYPVNKLTILGLGDMVSGDIHDELRVTNEKQMIEAAIQLGLDAAEWIESFVPHFEQVVVDGNITGNHGRRSHKPQAKNRYDNFDWLVYQVLRLRLQQCGVEVRVPKAAHAIVEVCNRRLLVFHGDGIRSSMVGVPWGGIIRRCNELEKQYAAFGHIDHFVMGHWHTPNVVENKRIIVNGSVKGPDEYGISKGLSTPAGQLLLTFHPTKGMTDVSFLDLQAP